jgi:hypothetical protein
MRFSGGQWTLRDQVQQSSTERVDLSMAITVTPAALGGVLMVMT